MKIISAITLASAFLLSSVDASAAAGWLHVNQSIDIDAPAGKVWKAVENFDGLNTWHPAVAKDEIVEGTNNQVGAVRQLTLKDGGTIKEKLLAFTPAAHSFRYAILEGVLPVSSYTSSVSVKSTGKGKCTVTWTGKFKRKDTSDSPADNANDKTAVDTITGVYQGGLQNLKKMMESGS
jgi:mxaD protein